MLKNTGKSVIKVSYNGKACEVQPGEVISVKELYPDEPEGALEGRFMGKSGKRLIRVATKGEILREAQKMAGIKFKKKKVAKKTKKKKR